MTNPLLSKPRREDIIFALVDLKHDLGKYIRLPVALLPVDATAAELASAIDQALHATRRAPSGVQGAEEIFDAFRAECGEALMGSAAFDALCLAVRQALALGSWTAGAKDGKSREEALLRLSAVGAAIVALIEEVRRA